MVIEIIVQLNHKIQWKNFIGHKNVLPRWKLDRDCNILQLAGNPQKQTGSVLKFSVV